MTNNDTSMTYIDLNDHDLGLDVIRVAFTHSPSWEWDHRPSNFWGKNAFLVWLVTGGTSTLQVDGDVCYEVRRGDFFLMPPRMHNYRGRQDPADPIQVFWFCLSFTDRDGSPISAERIQGIPFHFRPPDFESCHLLTERLCDSSEGAQPHWAFCLLHEIQRQFTMESGSQTEQQIVGLAREIRRRPGRFRGLEDMSEELPMTKDHFIRLFKKQLGMTPIEYLIGCRVEQAQGMLMLGRLSIKEIAAELGYSDQSVFSRQFKERTGVSPSRYRNQSV